MYLIHNKNNIIFFIIVLIIICFCNDNYLIAMDKKISVEISKIAQSNNESIQSNSSKIIEKIYNFLNQKHISSYDVDYFVTIIEDNINLQGCYKDIEELLFNAFKKNSIKLKIVNQNDYLWDKIGSNLYKNITYYEENFNHDYENSIIAYILIKANILNNYSIISDMSDMHCTDLEIIPEIFFLKKIPQETLVFQYQLKIESNHALYTCSNQNYVHKLYSLHKVKIKDLENMSVPKVNCDSEFVMQMIQEKQKVETKILLFCPIEEEIRLYTPYIFGRALELSRYQNKEIEIYVILENN